MDIQRAREIIATLAEGIDPLTGEILPSDHLCNQGDIVRALYALLNAAQVGKESAKEKTQPDNAGKPWTNELDNELKELFEQGESISTLSKHFGRTRNSIEARLEKLGVKEAPSTRFIFRSTDSF